VRHLLSSGGMLPTAIRKKWWKRGTQACLQLPLWVPLTGTRESHIRLQQMNLRIGHLVSTLLASPCDKVIGLISLHHNYNIENKGYTIQSYADQINVSTYRITLTFPKRLFQTIGTRIAISLMNICMCTTFTPQIKG